MLNSGLQGPKIGKNDPPDSFLKYVHKVKKALRRPFSGPSVALQWSSGSGGPGGVSDGPFWPPIPPLFFCSWVLHDFSEFS